MGNDVAPPRIRVFDDPESLANHAADVVAEKLQAAVEARGRAHFALAGGSTPRRLYERLASDRPAPPWWSEVQFLFGDERAVPPHDAASNYRMARETLLDPLDVSPDRVHRIHGELPSETAAAAYESELRALMVGQDTRLDMVLLGLGEDGHTASLFPKSPGLDEKTRWVISAQSPVAPTSRVTLTLPILNQAEQVFFLVTGRVKSAAVTAILGPSRTYDLPAARVRPFRGRTTWWLDREAASSL